MKVLCIAAHPDDEVLGCGGTMARLVSEGHNVYVAILGEGMTSRYAERDLADPGLIAQLHGNSQRAMDIIGAHELFIYDLPDNRFDTVSLLQVTKVIEDLIATVQPQLVFTQHGGDLNIDHERIFRATLTATRPAQQSLVRSVYAYEVLSSTEWSFGQFSPHFQPNTFIDISRTLNTKIFAMQAYETELRTFPHPRSPEGIKALAELRGTAAGLHAAEAFQLVRTVLPNSGEKAWPIL